MKIAVANSRKSRLWVNKDISFEELCQRLSSTVRTTETAQEYARLPKGRRDEIKDIGGFVGGHLSQGRRRKGMVLARSCLTLDLDWATPSTWEEHIQVLPYQLVAHSTHRHTPEAPRLRLIVPLTRDVSEAEYPAVARMFASHIGMDVFDDTTFEANRLMYWPSTPANGEYFYQHQDGDLLDPDVLLVKYDDPADASTWPTSTRQSQAHEKARCQAQDPRQKKGVVGAFCRTYPLSEAIQTFLADVYGPTDQEDRFDYLPASSSAGVVVYDDLFAYSHHATDPACGVLANAFDLVRIHKYADLDADLPADTPVTGLGSYKAMCELAISDERVRQTLASERLAEAEADFTTTPESDESADGDGWMGALQYEKRSTVLKNNLHNLLLIMQNDKGLKNIVFNQLADSLEIAGPVPWNAPGTVWRDQDDAQLVCYVDARYGTFSQRNFEIAVTKVADDRSYHPIRNYLTQLPEWDGVARVETLLVDYLGAQDSAYVRAVTRKTLCAAIRRVLEPGCKFDTMLVLNGPQGIGKSTLIARLAGPWFSDSLNLSDTKDKTAAEKLQGYWIIEIGELAGLRKTEVETLRSFLTRQNDIYRASFGRRATPHLRQCVFFGTTNAENGYLRDTTGNRRFWPVATSGGGQYQPWNMKEETIKQIWAETLTYVEAGEPLYLEADLLVQAQAHQHQAMETDEREGLVRDYLDTLLPDGWQDMGLYDRRQFLDGQTDFGALNQPGIWPRESVCCLEVWCECFGKNRADITPLDSARIKAILIKLGWIRQAKKRRISLYGSQVVYVPDPTKWPVFPPIAEHGCSGDSAAGTRRAEQAQPCCH